MRNFGMTKAQRQAEYLAAFSDAVVTAAPQHAGRIEWPTAIHYYHTGTPVAEAAARYVANRIEEE